MLMGCGMWHGSHPQGDNHPFHLSLVTASFDCPYRQNPLSAVWRLDAQAEFLWRNSRNFLR
jgi:hypothetical protein